MYVKKQSFALYSLIWSCKQCYNSQQNVIQENDTQMMTISIAIRKYNTQHAYIQYLWRVLWSWGLFMMIVTISSLCWVSKCWMSLFITSALAAQYSGKKKFYDFLNRMKIITTTTWCRCLLTFIFLWHWRRSKIS